MKNLLVLGDVHANWPALKAIMTFVPLSTIDGIINTGDTTVYGPFPNKTVRWFRRQNIVMGIKGNTDSRMLKILAGKKLKKPRKKEKRVMYHWTAGRLSPKNRRYLDNLPKKKTMILKGYRIGIFHGSCDNPKEALHSKTPIKRFRELASQSTSHIHIMGHSHFPYYKMVKGVHFINPGSVGRPYDGDPRTSFAMITISSKNVSVKHYRIPYAIEDMILGLEKHGLPPIYKKMAEIGRKLN